MNITFDKKWFNPLYFILNNIIKDNSIRTVLIYGGKSSAKTVSICQIVSKECLLSNASAIAFRKESTIIRTTLKKSFNLAIDKMYLYPAFAKYDLSYRCTNGSEIILKGLDSEEKAKGIESYKYVYLDELNHFEYLEYEQFQLSLRGIIGQKIFASWNPVDESSWVKVDLIDKKEWNRCDKFGVLPCPHSFISLSTDGSTILIKTTYQDNFWIAGSPDGSYGYHDENLIAQYKALQGMNENSYNVNVLGEWGVVNMAGRWIYVDYTISSDHIPTIEGNTIYLSFDFNNEPMTCTAWQFSSGTHAMSGDGHFVRAIAEFETSMADTNEEIIQLLCKKIKARFPYHPLRVTGDANGYNRLKGVAGNKSIFTLIANYLNISSSLLDTPAKDMELIPSRALCNTFMFNHKNVQLSTANTPKMIKDIRNAKANPDKQDQIIKDRESNKNDYFDTFRYIIHTYFNYFLRN